MAENFLNLKKQTDFKVQETQRIPNKINPKRLTTTTTKIITKMEKIRDKERILKET